MSSRKHRVLLLGMGEEIAVRLEARGLACLRFEDPLRALARLAEDDVDLLVARQDLPLLSGERVVVSARARGRPLPAVLAGEAGPLLSPAQVHRIPATATPDEVVEAVLGHLSTSTSRAMQR